MSVATTGPAPGTATDPSDDAGTDASAEAGSGRPAGDEAAEPDRAPDGPRAPELRLVVTAAPDEVRDRLAELATIVPPDADPAPHAEIVSTRAEADTVDAAVDASRSRGYPVLVLAHTGAEPAAADLVARGATGIVGEGNEGALLGLLPGRRTPGTLLASFERRFGGGVVDGTAGRDPATGLGDRRAFDRRLADADEPVVVALLRVRSDRWDAATPDAAVGLQRRRLATTLAHLAAAVDVELYAAGPAEFAAIGPATSPGELDTLGARWVAAAAAFRDLGLPLRLVVGHAASATGGEPEATVELARRALDVAAVDGARPVLGADELALGVSITTELEATLRVVDTVEVARGLPRGHGERVGRIAAELGRALGWAPGPVARVQLAGHLHGIGWTTSGPAASEPNGDLAVDVDHPVRGAEALRLTAGPAVADAVRWHRERWDGSGFPDGLRAADVPEPARVVAAALAVETAREREQRAGATGARLAERVAEAVGEAAGRTLDPALADLVAGDATSFVAAADRADDGPR